MFRAKRARAAAAAAVIACIAFLLSACSAESASGSSFAMGSVLTARIYADADAAQPVLNDIYSGVNALDRLISATDEQSELSRLNASGSGTCSEDTLWVLRDSLALCRALNGRLDITLGAVTSLWGFAGDAPRLPAAEEISAALQTRGPDKVQIKNGAVTLGEGQKLDPGAVGKGAGCDVACGVLKTAGLPAVISFGGTVLLYGQKPGGSWSVGLRDPFGGQEDYFATLSFAPEAADGAVFISTSGSYEKTFTENGKTYHHILDPDTGYPVETELVAVSAVGENGLTADALSTALFVNGLNETSLGWADTYLTGAVFVFSDGRVYVTPGLRDAFTLTDEARFSLINSYA